MADLAARLRTLVSDYDRKWSALDISGVAGHLIFHHMESQVYLEGGLRHGSPSAPDDQPHHQPGR